MSHSDDDYIGQAYARDAASRAQQEAMSARAEIASVRAEIESVRAELRALREHVDHCMNVHRQLHRTE